ncbi:MAG: hypothetical protein IPK00_18855 [Deltaproteobacteria bacterium]|nr:hypothetical protein [Deltaproteobacteria bacterium]
MVLPYSSCQFGGVWGVQYEGLYTDRFTYHPGEMINVHCSLKSGARVPFMFVRIDVRPEEVPLWLWATPQDFGNPNPGPEGALFPVSVSVPADAFEPGVYKVSMPPEAMLPENRLNVGNGFPSDNSVAFFVVTPAVAGSTSRILWVHDSLTGVAYGGFGDQSIYPSANGSARTVSYLRPGLDRAATWSHGNVAFLRGHGYEFEFADLVDLAFAPPGHLDAYDLVCFVGQFEYMPNEVMSHLAAFQAGGGNLFVASHEFGIFRVRLDPMVGSMTTYKWDDVKDDPYWNSGPFTQLPLVAGVGMRAPASPWETEIIGQTVWPAHRISIGEFVSFSVYNLDEAGWIVEGTGIGAGDAFPGAIAEYVSGLCVEYDGGQPRPILVDDMRLPEGLVIWGARPSSDGLDWRAVPGTPTWQWPPLAGGHGTATYQQRSSGAQVVTLPSPTMCEWTVGVGYPAYDRMLLNIFARLSVRA